MSSFNRLGAGCSHSLRHSHSLSIFDEYVRSPETSGHLFCEMLKIARSPLEVRWSVFFSAWGIPYEYNDEFPMEHGRAELPDFFLKGVNAWVEIRPQHESHDVSSILDEYTSFVWHKEQPLIVLFGAPQIRIPKSQGWALQRLNDELVATPIHLTECPGCGGFRASGVGSVALRKKRPELYHLIQIRATTPTLMAAYDTARTPHLLMH